MGSTGSTGSSTEQLKGCRLVVVEVGYQGIVQFVVGGRANSYRDRDSWIYLGYWFRSRSLIRVRIFKDKNRRVYSTGKSGTRIWSCIVGIQDIVYDGWVSEATLRTNNYLQTQKGGEWRTD